MVPPKEPYSFLLDKLRTPHPSVQKFAVASIFEKLKNAPPHLRVQSQLGQEALSRCLASVYPCVIDQTVAEISLLVEQGHMPIESGLYQLQAALDSAGVESVSTIVRGIGFLSRLLLNKAKEDDAVKRTLQNFLSPSLHPFVKAFRSRSESHLEVLQQVVMIVAQVDWGNQWEAINFLQPFTTYVLLQPAASIDHSVFSRQLHFNLASLGSMCNSLGCEVLRLLIHYIQYYPLYSVEEVEIAVTSVRELVDALQSVLKQANIQGKVDQYKIIMKDIFNSLIGLCHELKGHRFSLLPVFTLLGRVNKLQKLYMQDSSETLNWQMVSLAYILANTDMEQEQIMLLDLAKSWPGRNNSDGQQLPNVCMLGFPTILVWIFPSLHVLSSPCSLVKVAATQLLLELEKCLEDSWIQEPMQRDVCHVITVGSVDGQVAVAVHRLLQHLWFEKDLWMTWSFLQVETGGPSTLPIKNNSEIWLKSLFQYLSNMQESQPKPVTTSGSGTDLDKGLPLWICMLLSALIMHPRLAISASEAMASLGRMEPMWGLSLLPVVLFYLRVHRKHGAGSDAVMVVSLLQVIPALACHPITLPLISQTLQPMLGHDSNFVLQATAIRLLCKAWELTNRLFSELQMVLEPASISKSVPESQTIISRAACIYDVCRIDFERGIELVLSVQACIENKNAVVRALGLQSLASLCKNDVIDFYTAWHVISGLFPGVPSDLILTESLCLLLSHGALDAAAHPDAARSIVDYLWEIAAMKKDAENNWSKVQVAALRALSNYEVEFLEGSSGNGCGRIVNILLSETHPGVLQACEDIIRKFFLQEYRNRPRAQNQQKTNVPKIGKLLDALPRVLFPSGEKKNYVVEFPGALLLFSPLSYSTRSQTSITGSRNDLKTLQEQEAHHEEFFIEVAEKLSLSGNLIIGLVSLQSWSYFLAEWLQAKISVIEVLNKFDSSDEHSARAAEYIMKVLCRISDEAIPRVAENAVLALAALCQVIPISAHKICVPITKYLEFQLLQDGHEYLQWTSALSLGVVCQCLHGTDWILKSDIVHILLEHAGRSDRDIVKGACSLALGLASQNLVNRGEGSESLPESSRKDKERETTTLVFLIKNVANMISKICPITTQALQKLQDFNLLNASVQMVDMVVPEEAIERENGFVWAVMGLAVALGWSVLAVERAGYPALVLAITEFLISAITALTSEVRSDASLSLAAGSFLALPNCVEVCLHLELFNAEVDILLQNSQAFIQSAINAKGENIADEYPVPLVVSACIGSGNLLATILKEGTHPLSLEFVQQFLEVLWKVAKGQLSTSSSLGGMIGLANAFGAAAVQGAYIKRTEGGLQIASRTVAITLDKASISSPILFQSSYENVLQRFVQDIVLIAREAQDLQLKAAAGWALGLMRKALGREVNPNGSEISYARHIGQKGYQLMSLKGLPENCTTRLLCSWLLNLRSIGVGSVPFPFWTAVSVLRCFFKAPSLPALDWGSLIRQLMYETSPLLQIKASSPSIDYIQVNSQLLHSQYDLRKQCIIFSLAYAEKIPALAAYIDELCDLSRLISLEPLLSQLLIVHMVDLKKLFSESRMEIFLTNCIDLIRSYHQLKHCRRQFQICFWKGLTSLLKQSSDELDQALQFRSCIEKCMEILLDLLPSLTYGGNAEIYIKSGGLFINEEWSAALDCMSLAPKSWVLKITQVDWKQSVSLVKEEKTIQKAIFVRCQMVFKGCLPPFELKRPVIYLVNQEASKIWMLLMGVTLAMRYAPVEVKKEWLIDSIEAACLTSHPGTALVFLSLLVASWVKYAPLLIVCSESVLQDLPFTLPLLLSENGWSSVLSFVPQKCITLLGKVASLRGESSELLESILRKTCTALKQHLPLSDQLGLAKVGPIL